VAANSRLEESKHKSAATKIEAEAEGKAYQKLENKRRFTEDQETVKGLASIAQKAKVVFSGETGEQLLKYFDEALENKKQ